MMDKLEPGAEIGRHDMSAAVIADGVLVGAGEVISLKVEMLLHSMTAGDAVAASALRAEVHAEIDSYLDRVCGLILGASRTPGSA